MDLVKQLLYTATAAAAVTGSGSGIVKRSGQCSSRSVPLPRAGVSARWPCLEKQAN